MDFPRSYPASAEEQSCFQPNQIVCLEHENRCLYAEVIQIVELRQVCWARPLMMITHQSDDLPPSLNQSTPVSTTSIASLDLRQGSDLLLPIVLFRQALDTEVIPLLAQLQTNKGAGSTNDNPKDVQQQLNQFIRQLCRGYPNLF